MTDKDYTHLAFFADRSGSMAEMADPPKTKAQRTTEGIHAMVEEQRKLPGRITFSLTDFDTTHRAYDKFGDGSKIMHWTCQPRGGTALLDAVGTGIVETGEQLSALPEGERPGRVILVIATDGEENSSVEYAPPAGLDRIREMITHQKDVYGWDVVFIGADIDAFSAGASMGISYGSTLNSSGLHMAAAYASTSSAVTRSRVSGQGVSYSTEEREQAEGTDDSPCAP